MRLRRINSIEQGTRDPLLIFGHQRMCAGRLAPAGSRPERGAWLKRITIISTWAGIHTIGPLFALRKRRRHHIKSIVARAQLTNLQILTHVEASPSLPHSILINFFKAHLSSLFPSRFEFCRAYLAPEKFDVFIVLRSVNNMDDHTHLFAQGF